VLASYNTTSYLVKRHDIPEDLAKNIAGIDALVKGALGGGDVMSGKMGDRESEIAS
jgi:hypothetical protein